MIREIGNIAVFVVFRREKGRGVGNHSPTFEGSLLR